MSSDNSIRFRPIGTIHSPFVEQNGTPTQPRNAPGTEGSVTISPEFEPALLDLGGFDRVWLIYWFDRSRPPELTVVPYHDTKPHGLFATRAPSRINGIGMSPVRLLGIEGNVLRVGEIDILDGTPLLDIKPYVPKFDSYPEALSGWLGQAPKQKAEVSADDRFSRP
jgi:tRNA-Thr(GGU) m(6)t(6)A37 methyltransferase TsaA